MKKLYHLTVSSHHEVLCRNREDYIRLQNQIALCGFRFDSDILAYSLMSTHYHIILQTDCIAEFARILKGSYTQYFNHKYLRQGTLGSHYHCLGLSDIPHILAAVSYVLRNPLHHGISATPFSYPFSSIDSYFRQSIHHGYQRAKIPAHYRPRIAKNRKKPQPFITGSQRQFLPESFVQTNMIEHFFKTERSFLFYMNRPSNEEWIAEQKRTNSGKDAITLEIIENEKNPLTIQQMLRNEYSHHKRPDDTEICRIIDCELLGEFKSVSYANLKLSEKQKIAEYLIKTKKTTMHQAGRCLGMPLREFPSPKIPAVK